MEDSEEELSCRPGNVIGERQLFLANIGVQLLVVLALEWESAAKEGIEENTERPHVDGRSGVFNLAHDLRGHVRRSTTENFDLLLVWNASREPKIDQLHSRSGLIEQNVFKFDVSMGHISLMKIVNSENNLLP